MKINGHELMAIAKALTDGTSKKFETPKCCPICEGPVEVYWTDCFLSVTVSCKSRKCRCKIQRGVVNCSSLTVLRQALKAWNGRVDPDKLIPPQKNCGNCGGRGYMLYADAFDRDNGESCWECVANARKLRGRLQIPSR